MEGAAWHRAHGDESVSQHDLAAGDAILADESGVVVVRPWEIDYVVEEAMKRQLAEPETVRRLRAGEKLHEIRGAGPKVRGALARE